MRQLAAVVLVAIAAVSAYSLRDRELSLPVYDAAGDCPSGMKSCGSICCNKTEACCTKSDGTKFCDEGRCP